MKLRALTFAGLAAALLLAPLGASASTTNYSAVIPGVLSYPTTTLKFSTRSLLGVHLPVSPSAVRASFDNPSWAATVSEIQWKTSTQGTSLKFTCAPSSAACMQATGGSGVYTYSLLPSTESAPSNAGAYSLTWYVRPPGGYHDDDILIVTAPEPGTPLLLIAGLVGFLLLARKRTTTQGRRAC